MKSLVFVSLEDWDHIWRRNQFFCAEMSRRDQNRKILFVGLSHDITHALRQGKRPRFMPDSPQPLPDFPNIFLFRPVKWLPNTLRLGRKINEWVFRLQVRRAAHQLKLEEHYLWLNPHSAQHMVGKMGEKAVIYDITDDWISFNQSPALKELTIRQDYELCQEADLTIVCSQRLFELKHAFARRLVLIPNGVDAAHYAGIASGKCAPAPKTKAWNSPILGYVGTVHPERVDLDLVAKVAQAFPEGTVALIGPHHLSDKEKSRLEEQKNIVILGSVDYKDVPGYLAAFDVCLVPHLESEFTESLNPIKLWEYLASGKPVVSTDVAGFRDVPRLCHIASGPEAFVRACRLALTEDSALQGERLELAANNSWQSRVDELETLFSSLVADLEPSALEDRAPAASNSG